MMDRLRAFASEGFTIQAAAGRVLLGVAAFAVLSAVAPGSDVSAPGDGMAREAYARLVAQVQDEVDDALGQGRVFVLDRTAPAAAEMRRIRAAVPGMAALRMAGATGDYPSAFNVTTDLSDGGPSIAPQAFGITPGTACFVGGAQPGATGAEVAGLAGTATVDAQRWALWREVGSCLTGVTPTAAETFAALMARRDGGGRDLVARMAGRTIEGEAEADRSVRSTALAAVAGLDVPSATTDVTLGLHRMVRVATEIARRAEPRIERVASLSAEALAPTPATGHAKAPVPPAPDADEDEDDAAPRP